MTTKAELLLGGPGLDGYAYEGEIFCVGCGQRIIQDGQDNVPEPADLDSNITPQPIFFGESDTPQHCTICAAYLYGG